MKDTEYTPMEWIEMGDDDTLRNILVRLATSDCRYQKRFKKLFHEECLSIESPITLEQNIDLCLLHLSNCSKELIKLKNYINKSSNKHLKYNSRNCYD